MEKIQWLERDRWIAAAQDIITAKGVESITIEYLSKTLNVDCADFYYYFDDRAELLSEVLCLWERNNNIAYKQAIKNSECNGVVDLSFINSLWLERANVDPHYDWAIRDWARSSKSAAKAVRRSDESCISMIESIFLRLGYSNDGARVRAQVAYFHQMGYFMLGLGELTHSHSSRAPVFMEMLLNK